MNLKANKNDFKWGIVVLSIISYLIIMYWSFELGLTGFLISWMFWTFIWFLLLDWKFPKNEEKQCN